MASAEKAVLARLAAELKADVAAAEQKWERLGTWRDRPPAGEAECYFAAGLLHHLFTAIESALVRVSATFEGQAPSGPDSHARLLAGAFLELRGVRPAVLPDAAGDDLRELLDFRHFYRHGYSAALRPDKLGRLVAAALRAWPDCRRAFDSFVDFVEQCAKASDGA